MDDMRMVKLLENRQLTLDLLSKLVRAVHLFLAHRFDSTKNSSLDINSLMHLAKGTSPKCLLEFVQLIDIVNFLDASEVSKIENFCWMNDS